MTLDVKEKKALSEIRTAKAREFLDDAESNFKEGRHKTSVNRSYYSALNILRALLILEGANPETHDGIITMVSLKFIKPGLLPVDVVKKFKVLLARRSDVDYGDFDAIDAATAEDSLKMAQELIKIVDAERKKLAG